MIALTRLNGHPITVNSELIKFVESIPDTAVSLVTGERLLVRETTKEVIARVICYRSAVLTHAWPDASSAFSVAAAALSATAAAKHASDDRLAHDHT